MKTRKLILLLIIILLLAIFLFSSQNGSQSINVSDKLSSIIIDKVYTLKNKEISLKEKNKLIRKNRYLIRKLAHFTLYFTLGILIYLLIFTYNVKKSFLKSILICLALASFDELHQLFTAGRSAKLGDVFIDTIGSIIGIILTIIIIKLFNKQMKNKTNKQS